MWPAWQVPPKYVTVRLLRAGWRVQAGHLVVLTTQTVTECAAWLDGNGYVRVATSLYERQEHAA